MGADEVEDHVFQVDGGLFTAFRMQIAKLRCFCARGVIMRPGVRGIESGCGTKALVFS